MASFADHVASPASVGTSPSRIVLHATAVHWLDRGLLLRGASGAGKSDLALRLIEADGELVADDLVALERVRNDQLLATAAGDPGLIELRGHGVFRLPFRAGTLLDAVIELAQAESDAARLPEAENTALLGVELPLFRLDPRPASALAQLRLLLQGERVA